MKILSTLIFVISISPAYAEIYKCIENGNISYQQTQCKQSGTEFLPKKDISLEQQKSATNKLTADLEAIAEKKKIQKKVDDKERLIRAKEENARANRAQAEETARQTDAIEESNKRNDSDGNQPYYYPNRPILKPKPGHPIVNPKPIRPIVKPAPKPGSPIINPSPIRPTLKPEAAQPIATPPSIRR